MGYYSNWGQVKIFCRVIMNKKQHTFFVFLSVKTFEGLQRKTVVQMDKIGLLECITRVF